MIGEVLSVDNYVAQLLTSADTIGDVFNRKLAVGLFVGLRIFHTDDYFLQIRLLHEICDAAPGTI